MNALNLFQYADHSVRTVVIEGEPWFVLADLCKVLEIKNPSAVVARLDDTSVNTLTLTEGIRGNPNVTIVDESGMYEVVIRSDKPQAAQFRWWITHEVLPTLRKTGTYTMAAALPQSYADALRELAATVEQREALAEKVAQDAPKVLFADAVSTSDTAILVGDLAKILRGNGIEIGANRLFATLRKDGYLISRNGSDWNMPTQRSMELGLFRIKETAVTHADGHVTVSRTPKVTGKGQTYFVSRYTRPLTSSMTTLAEAS